MLTVSSLSLPQTNRHNQPRRSWYESRKWGEGVVQSAVKLSWDQLLVRLGQFWGRGFCLPLLWWILLTPSVWPFC